MDGMKNAKVLDNVRKVVADWKRKRTAQCTTLTDGADNLAPCHVTFDEPSDRHCKRVRSGGCKNGCKCCIRRSVVKNYSNFLESGLPQRVLYYRNGEWDDLSKQLIDMLKDDFRAKKAVTEVVFHGRRLQFDFLHMIQIDMDTGLQQPVAWIDESGSCFFPEVYSIADEGLHPRGEDQVDATLDQNGTREINVVLDIAISGTDISKLGEFNKASVSHVKRLRIEQEPAGSDNELQQECSSNSKTETEYSEAIGENVPCPVSASEYPDDFGCKYGQLDRLVIGGSDYSAVQKMVLAGFGTFADANDIDGIFRGSLASTVVQARWQLFRRQVEVTKNNRSNANVQYAWLAASKEDVSRIMFHRLAESEMPKFKPTYGIGIHLRPTNCSNISATGFDFDEEGIQYMVLCRVIMGNMEVVLPGSQQSYPSGEEFDSGVDDLINPNHYIVWNMHMNSHIYPEYVVSFRLTSRVKGTLVARKINADVSGVTHSSSRCNQIQRDSMGHRQRISAFVQHPQEETRAALGLGAPKPLPTSPWMPFTMLFDALSNKIPRKDMDLIYRYFDEFRMKRMTRDELIKKMRSISGDDLLRSTINSLRHKCIMLPRHQPVNQRNVRLKTKG